MIRRPLSERFREPVLGGVKTSTIRERPWPVGVPIMLYCWQARPYGSPQMDVAPVVVTEARWIRISRGLDDVMAYAYGEPLERALHETEGFASAAELDAWFRPRVRPGSTVTLALMRFRRWLVDQHTCLTCSKWRGEHFHERALCVEKRFSTARLWSCPSWNERRPN